MFCLRRAYFTGLTLAVALLLAGCATCKDPLSADVHAALGVTSKDLDKVLDKTDKQIERNYEPVTILKRAEAHFKKEEFIEAQIEYERFLDLHPLHTMADFAQYKIATSWYCQIRTIDRDPDPARNALVAFERLRANFPDSRYAQASAEKIAEIRDGLAQYGVYVGRFYYKRGSYPAAIARFEQVLVDYPGEPARGEAMWYLALSLAAADRTAEARAALERLLESFPEYKNRSAVSRLRNRLKMEI